MKSKLVTLAVLAAATLMLGGCGIQSGSNTDIFPSVAASGVDPQAAVPVAAAAQPAAADSNCAAVFASADAAFAKGADSFTAAEGLVGTMYNGVMPTVADLDAATTLSNDFTAALNATTALMDSGKCLDSQYLDDATAAATLSTQSSDASKAVTAGVSAFAHSDPDRDSLLVTAEMGIIDFQTEYKHYLGVRNG